MNAALWNGFPDGGPTRWWGRGWGDEEVWRSQYYRQVFTSFESLPVFIQQRALDKGIRWTLEW